MKALRTFSHFAENIAYLCKVAVAPCAAWLLYMKALVHEPLCKQAAVLRWPPVVAVPLAVCEEVDAVFASDPRQRVQLPLTWRESVELIM